MSIPTIKKNNTRSTTLCVCKSHTIPLYAEMDGVKVNGAWHYQQCDCNKLPVISTNSTSINEGSDYKSRRCLPWKIRFEFSKKTTRNYFGLCLKKDELTNTHCMMSGDTALSISHILKVVLSDEDVYAEISVDGDKFIPLYTLSRFKLLTDVGRSLKSYLKN